MCEKQQKYYLDRSATVQVKLILFESHQGKPEEGVNLVTHQSFQEEPETMMLFFPTWTALQECKYFGHVMQSTPET